MKNSPKIENRPKSRAPVIVLYFRKVTAHDLVWGGVQPVTC